MDEKAVIDALNTLFSPGQVIELRIPKPIPISGYFNNFNLLAEAAKKFDGKVPGIYMTLNPINPALIYRAKNKLRFGREAHPTTSDTDVLRYSWLLLDFDPVRPAEISSSSRKAKLKTPQHCLRGWGGDHRTSFLRGVGGPYWGVSDRGQGFIV